MKNEWRTRNERTGRAERSQLLTSNRHSPSSPYVRYEMRQVRIGQGDVHPTERTPSPIPPYPCPSMSMQLTFRSGRPSEYMSVCVHFTKTRDEEDIGIPCHLQKGICFVSTTLTISLTHSQTTSKTNNLRKQQTCKLCAFTHKCIQPTNQPTNNKSMRWTCGGRGRGRGSKNKTTKTTKTVASE